MSVTYKIININLTTSISDEPVSDVPCRSCVRCCELLSPFLTPEEIASGLYPLSLIQPSSGDMLVTPEVGPIVSLYRKKDGGCGMLVDGQCSIYDHRPHACRQFDCRKGHHPSIPDMTQHLHTPLENI